MGTAIGAAVAVVGQKAPTTTVLIREESINFCADAVVSMAKKVIRFSHHIVSWRSYSDSTKALALFYVLGVAAGTFDTFTVALLIVNLVFFVPVQLKAREKLIETKIQPVLRKLKTHQDNLIAM